MCERPGKMHMHDMVMIDIKVFEIYNVNGNTILV